MTVHYNVTGAERKNLVKNIEELLGVKARYLGMPTMAYTIGGCTIDKEGTMTTDASMDDNSLEILLETLCERGFDAEVEVPEEAGDDTAEDAGNGTAAENTLDIRMPRENFTEQALENLFTLVTAKGSLLMKALGVSELPLRSDETGTWVCFPWFHGEFSPEEVAAYTHLVSALCKMAREQKRITAHDKPVENEKYAFRCFLLRLGFIGDESKSDRKILLRNLSGNSAFLSGRKREADIATKGGELDE